MNINNEIIRLKKEINELKSRNYQISSKYYKSTSTTNDNQSTNKTNMINYLSSLNELNNINKLSDKKSKKIPNNNLKIYINPPFKKGIFSYKSSFNNSPKNMILNTSKSSKVISPFVLDSNSNYNNENIYNSTINLNKYKIKISKNTETNSNIYEKYNTENPDLKNIKISTIKNSTRENKKYLILENDIFNDKKLFEKESRRMMIEYIKILKKSEKKELNSIIKINNFSEKILNQKKICNEIQQSSNLIHKNNNSSTFISYSGAQSIFNSMKDIKNPYLTSYQSFIKKMTDDKIDKIKMLKFLSIPRKFKLNFKGENFNFLFILRPNKLTFLNGIESYIFQWMDLKSQSYIGGFDLIKINSCYIKNNNSNIFIIETIDSNVKKLYEIDTDSFSITSYYVKSLNYLSQLEKCKIYNNNLYN